MRTVIWDYADEPIPKDMVADLQNFVKAAGEGEDGSTDLTFRMPRPRVSP